MKPYGRVTAWFYLAVWSCWVVGLIAFIPSGFALWSGVVLIVGVVGLMVCIQTVAATTAADKSLARWQLNRWRWKMRFATGWEIPNAVNTCLGLMTTSAR